MNHYDELDVDNNASTKEIKKAYKVKAFKHHPDKEGGDVDKFKAIQKAYNVLSDTEKRDHYDRTGQDVPKKDDPEQIIMAIFSQILESGDYQGNIIDRVKGHIQDGINKAEKDLIQNEQKIKKLDKQKGRIITSRENAFEMIIASKIEELISAKEPIQRTIKGGAELLLLLDTYSDSKPEEQRSQRSMFDPLNIRRQGNPFFNTGGDASGSGQI